MVVTGRAGGYGAWCRPGGMSRGSPPAGPPGTGRRAGCAASDRAFGTTIRLVAGVDRRGDRRGLTGIPVVIRGRNDPDRREGPADILVRPPGASIADRTRWLGRNHGPGPCRNWTTLGPTLHVHDGGFRGVTCARLIASGAGRFLRSAGQGWSTLGRHGRGPRHRSSRQRARLTRAACASVSASPANSPQPAQPVAGLACVGVLENGIAVPAGTAGISGRVRRGRGEPGIAGRSDLLLRDPPHPSSIRHPEHVGAAAAPALRGAMCQSRAESARVASARSCVSRPAAWSRRRHRQFPRLRRAGCSAIARGARPRRREGAARARSRHRRDPVREGGPEAPGPPGVAMTPSGGNARGDRTTSVGLPRKRTVRTSGSPVSSISMSCGVMRAPDHRMPDWVGGAGPRTAATPHMPLRMTAAMPTGGLPIAAGTSCPRWSTFRSPPGTDRPTPLQAASRRGPVTLRPAAPGLEGGGP
ncbi:hypothetical protein SAMN05444722_1873 [Rhodovulum sp. ES.010]|nr:hypothetical protein SAMN05444722_1873 [Rhodovulum sp. ES.010]